MGQDFSPRRKRGGATEPRRRTPHINDSSGNGFMRSRTLTGSSSSKIFSASEKHGFLTSSRLKAQNLKKHRAFLIVVTASSWLLVAGCLILLDQYIGKVTFSMNDVVKNTKLESSLQTEIQGYLNNRPSERFRFAIDNDQIAAHLRQQMPAVDSLAFVDEPGLGASKAVVAFREPVAKWHLGDDIYYVDASGQAFHDNYFAEPSVSVEDRSGLPVSDQRTLASRHLLTFIGQTVSAINTSATLENVTKVSIPAGTLKELSIRLRGATYPIRLHTDRAVESQVADIEAAIRYIESQNRTPDYVDVRIAGKAYYR